MEGNEEKARKRGECVSREGWRVGVREKGGKGRIEGRVADPERFDADPDSTFQAPPQLEGEG